MEPAKAERIDKARRLLAARLTTEDEKWSVRDRLLLGPNGLAIQVEDFHGCGDGHLDIGFIFNRERDDVPVLWDCVSGSGEGALARAIDIWAECTLPVFLELLTRDGSYADHFHGDDPGGCPGWHVIHGPWIAFGRGAAPDVLRQWALDNSPLAVVGPVAAKRFQQSTLNCVKLLFGAGESDVAEVRVNGERDESASEALLALPWPRSGEVAFARCFMVFVHSEHQ